MKERLIYFYTIVLLISITGCKNVDSYLEENNYVKAYEIAKTDDEKIRVICSAIDNNKKDDITGIISEREITSLKDENKWSYCYTICDDATKQEIIDEIVENDKYPTFGDVEKSNIELCKDLILPLINKKQFIFALECIIHSKTEEENTDVLSVCVDELINDGRYLRLIDMIKGGHLESKKDEILTKCYEHLVSKKEYRSAFEVASEMSDEQYEKDILYIFLSEGNCIELQGGKSAEFKKYEFWKKNIEGWLRAVYQGVKSESKNDLKKKQLDQLSKIDSVFRLYNTSEYNDDYMEEKRGAWFNTNEIGLVAIYTYHKGYFSDGICYYIDEIGNIENDLNFKSHKNEKVIVEEKPYGFLNRKELQNAGIDWKKPFSGYSFKDEFAYFENINFDVTNSHNQKVNVLESFKSHLKKEISE